MSYVSDALGQGAYEIGDLILAQDLAPTFIRKGRTFARCGSAIPAASYPMAATDPRTMISGIASTGFPAANYIRSYATNGTGTWVFVTSSSTNVYVSTDNCATLTSVASANAYNISDVVYNASVGRFITFGNDANVIGCSYATNPDGTWSGGGTYTPGINMSPGSIRAACDGTTVVATWDANVATVNCVLTTTDASSLTVRALGSSISGTPIISVLPSLGVSRWLIIMGTSQFVSTASDGSAWGSASTSPQSAIGNIVGLASGNGKSIACGRTSYAISTNNTSWTTYSYPLPLSASVATFDGFAPGAMATTAANWINFDGSHFVTGTATYADFGNAVQGRFGWSADGITWATRQLTYPSAAAANSQRQQASANGYLVSFQTGAAGGSTHVSFQRSANWKTTCDYVGVARPLTPTLVAGNSAISYFVSIS